MENLNPFWHSSSATRGLLPKWSNVHSGTDLVSANFLSAMICCAVTAKFRFWPWMNWKVAIPITWPLVLTTGLPLDPGEMGADIWNTRPTVGISRTEETMPSLTVCSKPMGLPTTTMRSAISGDRSLTEIQATSFSGMSTCSFNRSAPLFSASTALTR